MAADPLSKHRLLPLVALLVSGVAPAARAQQDTAFAEIVLRIEVGRAASATVVALARDSAVFVPLRGFLDLAELRVEAVVPGARFSGALPGGGASFTVDTEKGLVTRGDVTAPLSPGQVVWRGDGLYCATGQLGDLLGVRFEMDWSDLTLEVGDADRLPVLQRLARERRRAALLRPRAAPQEAIPEASGRTPFADGVVLDWAWTSATRSPFAASSFQLGLGAELAGGSLEIQHLRQRVLGGYASETHWQWGIAWPARPWLKQARLGETLSGGQRPRLLRGALVSNAPYLRPGAFGVAVLDGRPGLGWEVETYRGGELVGYAAADSGGRYRIATPVSYGPNPVDVVAYGPHGEMVRAERALFIPTDRLPAGHVEYTLAGGRCLADPCRDALLGDVRVGVSESLTFQLGSDAFWRDSLPALWHPWALVAVAPMPALNLTAEAVARGLLRARLDYDPNVNLHVDVTRVRYDTTVTRPLVGSASVRDQTLLGLFWRPGSDGGGPFFVQAALSRATGFGVVRDLQRLTGTWRVLGVRAAVTGVRIAAGPSEGPRAVGRYADLSVDGVLRGPFRWLGGTYASATLGSAWAPDSFRLIRAAVAIGRQVARGLHLDVQATWLRGRRGVGLDLIVSTAVPGLRAVSHNSVTADDGLQGVQVLEGSVMWDRRRGRVDLGSGRNLGRGGITGVVFQDLNGNGVRDAGEPGLPHLLLQVGSVAVTSDSAGRFTVHDLVPFEAVVLALDTLSLQDPTLIPETPQLRVRPSPNSYQMVQVGLVRAAELSGRVLWPGRQSALGGLTVVLRNQADGRERTTTTFSDGSFYVMGLRRGHYWVFLDLHQAERLNVRSEPVDVTVVPSAEQQGAEVTLRIESAGQR